MKKLLSIILSCVLAIGCVPYVSVSSVKGDGYPFVIENTNYGVQDTKVVAKKIKLTDSNSRFITCDDVDGNGNIEDYCHGNGVVTIKQKASGGKANYYLVGKDGLIKEMTNCSKKPTISALGHENWVNWSDEEYSYDRRNDTYDDALYAICDNDKDKRDVYNATTGNLYEYGLDSINSTSDKYGSKYGLFEISKNGKKGIMKSDGTIMYDTLFEDLDYYKNCIVASNENGDYRKYALLSYDGKSSTNLKYDAICCDRGVVYGVGKAGSEEWLRDYAVISIESLNPISDYIYEDNMNCTKRDGHYCVIAKNYREYSSNQYGATYDVFYDDHKWNLNDKFGGQISRVDTDINDRRPYYGLYDSLVLYIPKGSDISVHWVSKDGNKIYHSLEEYSYSEFISRVGYINNSCVFYDYSEELFTIKNLSDGTVCSGLESIERADDLIIGRYNDSEKHVIIDSKTNNILYNNVYLRDGYINDDYVNAMNKAILVFDSANFSNANFGILNSVTKKFSGFIYKTPKLDNDAWEPVSVKKEWHEKKGYVWEICFECDDDNDGTDEEKFLVVNDEYKTINNSDNEAMFCDEDLSTYYISRGEYISGYSYSGDKLFEEKSPEYIDEQVYWVPRDAYIIAEKEKNEDEYDERKEGLISKDGDTILDTDYDAIGVTHRGMTFAEKSEENEDDYYDSSNTSYMFDLEGNAIIEGEFNSHWLDRNYKHHIYNMGNDSIISLGYDDDVYIYDYTDCIGKESETDYTNVMNKTFKTVYNQRDLTFSSSKNEGYYYSDSYFNEKATVYQQSLATMSLCMAFSTYGKGTDYDRYDKNVHNIMKQCGFAQNGKYDEKHFNEKPTKTSIGCVIGSKMIDDTTVIAVAVRSGGYGLEWASNFELGSSSNHKGFDDSANKVQGYINSYINEKDISGKIKIWITGFSRGAAVATETAAKLNSDFGKTNVYAYGFATPAGILSSNNPHSSSYNNIFSIIDFNDPIPLVAPKNWRFDRYGITKILPFQESADSKNYQKYINRIKNKLDYEYRIDEFNGTYYNNIIKDTLGSFNRKLVNNIANLIGTRGNYVLNYQSAFVDALSEVMAKEQGDGEDPNVVAVGQTIHLIKDKVPQYFFQHPIQLEQLMDNIDIIADVHANPKYYVYWMQMMDGNYNNNLPVLWGDYNYRVFKVNCPVDVFVYDSSNKKVASIEWDEPVYYEDSNIMTSIDENGQKMVYLPIGEEFNIKVVAREDCKVSCGFDEFNAEYGEQSRLVNFKTTSLKEDETLKSSVDAFSSSEIENGAENGSDVDYNLTLNSNNVDIQSDIKGPEEIADHTYELKVDYDDSKGTIYGGGSFVEGSYAKLEAENKPGYDFDGFYINGELVENVGSEYDKYSVRLQMNDNITVEARFSKCSHDWDDGEITKEPTYSSTGVKTYTCYICGATKTEKVEIKNKKTQNKVSVPPKSSIKTIKAKKKSLKVTWKKIGGIKGYKLQYGLKKNFKRSKTKTIGKASKTSVTLKKLKRKKKYFLRIRTFKIVGGRTYLSGWSKKKSKKTK